MVYFTGLTDQISDLIMFINTCLRTYLFPPALKHIYCMAAIAKNFVKFLIYSTRRDRAITYIYIYTNSRTLEAIVYVVR